LFGNLVRVFKQVVLGVHRGNLDLNVEGGL
jgi:hypothetical protein